MTGLGTYEFHVVALVKDAFEGARRRVQEDLEAARRRPRAIVPAPRARRWQSQEELDARASERRNRALAKIADALAGGDENHRELRRAYLMLQLFYEWAAADFATAEECREALSSWTG